MTFRTYRQVSGGERSAIAEQVSTQRARVKRRLARVRRVVAVLSGKGGVGKSFVTAALAGVASRRWPDRVGVLDADLGSPTVARMLGVSGPLRVADEGVLPARGAAGVRVISTDLLLEDGHPLGWRGPDGDAFAWRGVVAAGVLREFVADVAWGDLELLLVDFPPGSEAATDFAELAPGLAALAVTLPAEEARRSVGRAMRAAAEAGVRLIGVVENMAGVVCGACGHHGPLFGGGGGAALAAEFAVPLLARLPFVPELPGGQAASVFAGGAAERLMEALA